MSKKNGREVYDCWLRILQHTDSVYVKDIYTDSVYVKDICFYYDNGHGDGRNY